MFPSFYEGMPNTVIEAQATGLPCVIADTITEEAGVTDCVHFMSLSDSPKVWADKVLSLLDKDKVDRSFYSDKMKNAGYDIGSCVKKFTGLVFSAKK